MRPLRVLVLNCGQAHIATCAHHEAFTVFTDVAELTEVLREAHPADVVLLDPLQEDGRLAPELRLIIRVAGLSPVVAWTQLRSDRMPSVRYLYPLGVSDVADAGLETSPAALLPRLAAAVGRPLKSKIEPVLPKYLSQNGVSLVRTAVDVVVRGGAAPEMAANFGSLPRTVARWCAQEGLPYPRRLHAWLRLLLAIALLEAGERAVLAAARGAGYSTEHSFRRALRALIGETAFPRAVSFNEALEAFVRELGEERDARRTRTFT